MAFSDYLKTAMSERQVGVNELARISGVSGAHISRMVNGKRSAPSPKLIKKLSAGLGIDYLAVMKAAGYVK